jgi:hypothetical protein
MGKIINSTSTPTATYSETPSATLIALMITHKYTPVDNLVKILHKTKILFTDNKNNL